MDLSTRKLLSVQKFPNFKKEYSPKSAVKDISPLLSEIHYKAIEN